MEIKTEHNIFWNYDTNTHKDKLKKWVSVESEIKWLNELEARIMIDYSKEELLLGVRNRIKKLKGDKNE